VEHDLLIFKCIFINNTLAITTIFFDDLSTVLL